MNVRRIDQNHKERISVAIPDDFKINRTYLQSVENRRKEYHQFCLHSRQAVIPMSNVRTPTSKKINGMALIRTLTVSTSAFERTKEKFYGFRQTV